MIFFEQGATKFLMKIEVKDVNAKSYLRGLEEAVNTYGMNGLHSQILYLS